MPTDPFKELGAIPVRPEATQPGEHITERGWSEYLKELFFTNARRSYASRLTTEERDRFLAGNTAVAGGSQLSPKEEFMQRTLPAIGQGLAIGSGFISPVAALASRGTLAPKAMSALRYGVEPAVAAGGTALDPNASPGAILAAGAGPFVAHGMANAGRSGARALIGTIAPDETRSVIRKGLAEKFGPEIPSKRLFAEFVNPNKDLFVHPRRTLAAARSIGIPEDLVVAGKRPADIITRFQNAFGPGSSSMQSLGNLQDYWNQLGRAANDAYEAGFKGYAQEIFKAQRALLDDMVDAVPQLSQARHAFLREMNVERLGKFARSGKPLDDFDDFTKTAFWRAGNYSKQENREIKEIFSLLATMGGGDHYFGKILGHGLAGVTGGGIGAGLGMATSAGPGVGFGMGAALGFMSPVLFGTMLSKPTGRALLKGLLKRNPAGWTAGAANAAYQWFQFDRAEAENTQPNFGGIKR